MPSAVADQISALPGGRRGRYLSGDALRRVHIIANWQTEHVVEVEDGHGLENLVELLQAQSNVKLVGYTAEPLDEAVDAAIDKLLDR